MGSTIGKARKLISEVYKAQIDKSLSEYEMELAFRSFRRYADNVGDDVMIKAAKKESKITKDNVYFLFCEYIVLTGGF